MYNSFTLLFEFGVLHVVEPNKSLHSNLRHLKCPYLQVGYAYMIKLLMM